MALTLSVDELLMQVIESFKVRLPMFQQMSTDFTTRGCVLGDTITARVRKVPTAQDYDAAQGGYKNGAQDSKGLLEDVPVTIDRHKHVPVKVAHIDAIGAKISLEEAAGDIAYALGKDMLDHALSLVVAANFSGSTIEAAPTKATLNTIREGMNTAGGRASGRFGLVNSAVATALDNDTLITSGDYYGQRTGANPYLTLTNITGFENIYEYPDLPANAENVTGFFGSPDGIIIAGGPPKKFTDSSGNIRRIADVSVQQDPVTGIGMAAVEWAEEGTFDEYITITSCFGAKAGKQGGADDAITDNGGWFLKSAA